MLALIVSALLAPHSGIVAIDGLGVGIVENGKWKSLDSIFRETWPSQTIPTDTVAKLTSGTSYKLGERLKIEPITTKLAFVGEDGDPGGRGWVLPQETEHHDEVVWFGPKPPTTKTTFASNTSTIYVKAVADYLKTKGFKSAKPILSTVVLADLDANGTNEALIFASSRRSDEMSGTFSLTGETKYPNDFSLVLIRYLSGRTVKTAELYYADGKKASVEGHCTFAGLWDLDGKPGLEILYRWGGYESWASRVAAFSKGKVVTLAEAGDGV